MDIKSDLSSLWDMIDAEFYYDDETYEQEEIYRDISNEIMGSNKSD